MTPASDTIATLDPSYKIDFAQKGLKNTPMPNGSLFNNLRAPSREIFMHRPYAPGDSLRFIDWRAYGRTDQLVVYEKREMAQAVTVCIVEVHDSMIYPEEADAVQKLQVALRVALHLCASHAQMGDRCHLQLLRRSGGDHSTRTYTFSSSNVARWQGLFAECQHARFSVEQLLAHFVEGASLPLRIDMMYFLSDGLDGEPQVALLSQARLSTYLHVLSSFEVSDDWLKDDPCYFDRGGNLVEYQGRVLLRGAAYIQAIDRWRQRLAQSLKSMGVSYHLLTEKTKLTYYESVIQQALGF